MKKKKNRLKKLIELGEDLGIGASEVSVVGRSEVKLSGCQRILVYESSVIALELTHSTVKIVGCELELQTYMGDRAVVCGRIDGLEFSGGGE